MTPTRLRLAVITLLFASLISVSSTLAQTEAVWLGGPGDWTEAWKWSTKPRYPNNDGIQSYSAVIDSGDVTLPLLSKTPVRFSSRTVALPAIAARLTAAV